VLLWNGAAIGDRIGNHLHRVKLKCKGRLSLSMGDPNYNIALRAVALSQHALVVWPWVCICKAESPYAV